MFECPFVLAGIFNVFLTGVPLLFVLFIAPLFLFSTGSVLAHVLLGPFYVLFSVLLSVPGSFFGLFFFYYY